MATINDYGFPFSSVGTDRQYGSAEWRDYFSRLISDGIIQNNANECKVKPQLTPNKTVFVDTGSIVITGAMLVVSAKVNLTIDQNTSGQARIDRIVARLNVAERKIEFAVLKGTPAVSPVAKALTRTSTVYELGLADITLANGYSTITESVINDQRWDVDLCGASSMTIGVIPPSGLDAVTVNTSQTTEEMLGLEPNSNVDKALQHSVDLSSYMAFCMNVNTDSLDSAFGKNNEDIIFGVGLQLAMFGWFKGADKTTFPFNELKSKSSVAEIVNSNPALAEIVSDSNISNIVYTSPYARAEMLTVKGNELPAGTHQITVNEQELETGAFLFVVTYSAWYQSTVTTNVKFNGVEFHADSTRAPQEGFSAVDTYVVKFSDCGITGVGTYPAVFTLSGSAGEHSGNLGVFAYGV